MRVTFSVIARSAKRAEAISRNSFFRRHCFAVGSQRQAWIAFALLFFWIPGAFARDLWTSPGVGDADESVLKLSSALKITGLGSLPPADPTLSQGVSSTGLLRLRLEPTYQTHFWKFDAAYDNQLYYGSGAGLAATYALPTASAIPFRLSQIASTVQSGNLSETQQLDRAFASYKTKSFEVTLGRQAIGWGRGTMFSAVDIFAPFSPLQIDEEWRPGVDALNADYKITDTTSIQFVAASGPSWAQSAMGGRLRGYLGPVDAELILAKRAQDTMYGAVSSAAIGGFEVHGELALFQTPGDTPSRGIFGDPSLIPKAVLGVSDNLPLGNGLKLSLEYHYSGFGAATASGLSSLLANSAFRARLIQGDTQILGDQVLGLSASYIFDQKWSAGLTLLQSLMDTSGVLAPSAEWDFSDSASLSGTAFLAYGAPSSGGILQSQYGEIPATVILQLKIYD